MALYLGSKKKSIGAHIIFNNVPEPSLKLTTGNPISIDNAASNPHFLKIKITKPNEIDYNSIQLNRYGKNLADISPLAHSYSARYNGYQCPIDITHLRGQTVTFQISVDYSNTIETTASVQVNLRALGADKTTLVSTLQGTIVRPSSETNTAYVSYKIPEEANNIYYLAFGIGLFFNGTAAAQAGSTITLYNPQLELGSKATDYEPFMIQTAIPDAEGNVVGLSSLSPNMTITALPEITIECQYQEENIE